MQANNNFGFLMDFLASFAPCMPNSSEVKASVEPTNVHSTVLQAVLLDLAKENGQKLVKHKGADELKDCAQI